MQYLWPIFSIKKSFERAQRQESQNNKFKDDDDDSSGITFKPAAKSF
jgi:hypothetical protein